MLRKMMRYGGWLAVAGGALILAGCTRPGDRLARKGDEIVIGGQLFHTGTPVVLWLDPKGYDAYRARCHFQPEQILPRSPSNKEDPNRYGERRNLPEPLARSVADDGWTLENVQQQVDQFVIHYDVCGTSRQCFKILHDIRGLSVPFMLDVDGTIYQTLDLKERAWHASQANDRSIGVEIAQIGAYPDMKVLDQWYSHDEHGWPVMTLPQALSPFGVRTPDFVGRPARKDPIRGQIHGRELVQYDFTDEQYDALSKLTAALHRALPKLRIDAPRAADGSVLATALSDDELKAYTGLLGHYHVTKGKTDPGPAFNWDRVLNGARRRAY